MKRKAAHTSRWHVPAKKRRWRSSGCSKKNLFGFLSLCLFSQRDQAWSQTYL